MRVFLSLCLCLLLSTSVYADTSYYYKKAQRLVGLNEVEDREQLTDLLNVDPVLVPWCGFFLTYIFENKDGLENPGLARSWLSLGTEVTEPKKGDLVIFSRNNSSWQGHVGFYVDEYEIDGIEYIVVLGGNQSNSIRYSLYRKTNLLGYRRLTF